MLTRGRVPSREHENHTFFGAYETQNEVESGNPSFLQGYVEFSRVLRKLRFLRDCWELEAEMLTRVIFRSKYFKSGEF